MYARAGSQIPVVFFALRQISGSFAFFEIVLKFKKIPNTAPSSTASYNTTTLPYATKPHSCLSLSAAGTALSWTLHEAKAKLVRSRADCYVNIGLLGGVL